MSTPSLILAVLMNLWVRLILSPLFPHPRLCRVQGLSPVNAWLRVTRMSGRDTGPLATSRLTRERKESSHIMKETNTDYGRTDTSIPS